MSKVSTVVWHLMTIIMCYMLVAVRAQNGTLSETNFPYHERLTDGYDLYWNFNTTHIIFRTYVKTKGFIGFGISPNGGMTGSDVIIGWVKNRKSFFADRHAEGHFQPILDARQDWFLISASEVGEYTTLTFIRKLDTCDQDDRPITNDTTRVIFSYNPNDPVNSNTIQYHGPERRGTKSILLLNPPLSQQRNQTLPDDATTIQFLNGNFSVPAVETFYRCKVFRLPELGQKHHLIRFEPVIQSGHEQLVHHMIIYYCPRPVTTNFDGASYQCYDQVPGELSKCVNALVGWAVGGQAFDYPSIAGVSLGNPEDPQILILETHYNNPTVRKDFVDNSGIMITLTKRLRPLDAGVMYVGFNVTDNHIIPSYEQSFLSTAHCPVNCIDKAVGDQEIHIFAALLHTHLIGRKLRTRHFRNGSELAPIIEDNNYDFNYQEFRKLSEERIVRKGDSLVQECVYDSTTRRNVTYGGWSTSSEMCLTYLLYYPKMNMTICTSSIQKTTYVKNSEDDVHLVMAKTDWTKPEIRHEFQQNVTNADIMQICWFESSNLTMVYPSKVPRYSNFFQPQNKCLN